MNTLTQNHIFQNCLRWVQRTWKTGAQAIGVSWVTVMLIVLLIPRPGVLVAPGGCTSTSGECGTSIET